VDFAGIAPLLPVERLNRLGLQAVELSSLFSTEECCTRLLNEGQYVLRILRERLEATDVPSSWPDACPARGPVEACGTVSGRRCTHLKVGLGDAANHWVSSLHSVPVLLIGCPEFTLFAFGKGYKDFVVHVPPAQGHCYG